MQKYLSPHVALCIKLFSINFESKSEQVLSGSLSLIQGVDIVRDGRSFSLIHRKQKSSPYKVIKVENGHRRGVLQIHQDEASHKQTLQMSDLMVDPPLLVGSALDLE